ncbi:histidine--tRNA ligase [Blochmannia endosymbiont of Camponotus (Colobopsis) obliquus]|uniref:histidine--tRNA ligase n=1 Tax=Blochmannia endosymbiont of Camponotus (Colobopsis) obliquus TaxID=1505597 RepID=UPI00061A8524|nr:histidine--tRNA ligase [Blochmannia endosymbiont of Camponotus (Colobopsis) obliquus]AKC60678.1 histidine--tRNA ligase [Blochmannia endosymbiont of Camponotus (Colobopsis) obliquus]
MSTILQAVRGMRDVLPNDTPLWQYIEDIFKSVLITYGYNEIKLPILENTSLFSRAIGSTTDVVEKEMYTFDDCNGVSLTLRPEGTAGCVRAGIEHNLFFSREQRLWCLGPMFRHERPQKGRLRQFYQLNVEVFGQQGPDIDFELIMMTYRFWRLLGISDYVYLELNSIGSFNTRLAYRQALVNFLTPYLDLLDKDSRRRFYCNPMRLLDSKNVAEQHFLKEAPSLFEYLDEESHVHFSQLCKLLDLSGIKYKINTRLVRGLDYYNRTVFEWFYENVDSHCIFCAGGRYDTLVEQLGGRKTPAIGFAIGIERLILLINDVNIGLHSNARLLHLDIYLISVDECLKGSAILLAERIRDALPSLRVITNHGGGSLKKQLSRANKNGARIALILGKKEFLMKHVLIRDLHSGVQEMLEENNLMIRLASIFKL